jgi:hypothetical protein
MMPPSTPRPASGRGEREVASRDGRLCFLLTRTSLGVHVDRQHEADLRRVAHAAVFPDRQQFERFLEVDELRFEYALVFVEVRRAFDELVQPGA